MITIAYNKTHKCIWIKEITERKLNESKPSTFIVKLIHCYLFSKLKVVKLKVFYSFIWLEKILETSIFIISYRRIFLIRFFILIFYLKNLTKLRLLIFFYSPDTRTAGGECNYANLIYAKIKEIHFKGTPKLINFYPQITFS